MMTIVTLHSNKTNYDGQG